MEPRAASHLLVSALIRHVESATGHGAVMAKGDPTAGAILLLIADRGATVAILERSLGRDGYRWRESGPKGAADRDAYLAGRRRTDPDLWIVELDHPEARKLALQILEG